LAKKKAVILLSGGLDSATTLAIARDKGFECYALTFRYGQRHEREIEAAKKIADSVGAAEHRVIDIDLGQLGGSALLLGTVPSTHINDSAAWNFSEDPELTNS
jgi:7-cyano-7-deazaguanine synthase